VAGEGQLFAAPVAAGDNLLLLRLRWVLLLWILAMVGVHYEVEPWRFWAGMGVVAVFAVSQLVLWRLPARLLKGMRLYTTVFLLDLGFVVGSLYLSNQAEPRLLLVMFLTLFITALVQRISLSLLVSVVVMAVYAGLRLQGEDSFGWEDARQLMDLPFLVITSLHAAVIIAEAGFHQEIMESLEADNVTLSKKLGLTSSELKERVRFVMGAFDAVPAAVLVLDPHGMIRAFNRHAEAIFGIARGHVLDRTLHSVGFLEPLREELKRRAGTEIHKGAWVKNAHGTPFFALVRNGIARDAEGALLNFTVFVSPTDAPPEAPTYEAWLAQQRDPSEEMLQDSGAPAAAAEESAPAPEPGPAD
jgi:PAS domain S-box-containing protein